MLGSLELSLDDPAQAWQALEDVPNARDLGRLGGRSRPSPTRSKRWSGSASWTAAEELLGDAREDRDRGQPLGGARRGGAARLCSASLGAIWRSALGAAKEAAAGFERCGFPLHSARSLYVAGEAQRRAGERRRAGEELDAARAIFLDLGAARWAERCDGELRRARPRPRRDGELTYAERRVAVLVADGREEPRGRGAALHDRLRPSRRT